MHLGIFKDHQCILRDHLCIFQEGGRSHFTLLSINPALLKAPGTEEAKRFAEKIKSNDDHDDDDDDYDDDDDVFDDDNQKGGALFPGRATTDGICF